MERRQLPVNRINLLDDRFERTIASSLQSRQSFVQAECVDRMSANLFQLPALVRTFAVDRNDSGRRLPATYLLRRSILGQKCCLRVSDGAFFRREGESYIWCEHDHAQFHRNGSYFVEFLIFKALEQLLGYVPHLGHRQAANFDVYMDIATQDNESIIAALRVALGSPIGSSFDPQNWQFFAFKEDTYSPDFYVSLENIYAGIVVGEIEMILPIASFLQAFDADYIDFQVDVSDDVVSVSNGASQEEMFLAVLTLVQQYYDVSINDGNMVDNGNMVVPLPSPLIVDEEQFPAEYRQDAVQYALSLSNLILVKGLKITFG